MAKKKQFTCFMCKKKYDYEPIEGYPWAHPTICDACDKKRKAELAEQERLKAEARRQEEIMMLPYPEWDSSKADADMHHLRNMIGTTVFENGKLTDKSVWVKGEVGCGKTRSICFIAKTVIERGGHVKYMDCMKLLGSYSESFMNGDTKSFLDEIGNDKRVLILDDYGVGKVTERGAELLYYIADERLIRGLPTWATSNLLPNQLNEWFPDNLKEYAKRIQRRINETFTIIEKGKKQ